MQIEIGNRHRGDRGVYVGRGTALGNPYVVGRDGTREECTALYRRWLWRQVKTVGFKGSPQIYALEALLKRAEALEKLMLICSCAPLPYHAKVVRDAILWLSKKRD